MLRYLSLKEISRSLLIIGMVFLVFSSVASATTIEASPVARPPPNPVLEQQFVEHGVMPMHNITTAQRLAAADRAAAQGLQMGGDQDGDILALAPPPGPGGTPDYFGPYSNYALSKLPVIDSTGNVTPGTGIVKFIDTLPGLGVPNNIGQYIPVAVNDPLSYPGDDYYVIAAVEYSERMSSSLKNKTTIRGYVQLETPNLTGAHIQLFYPNGTAIRDSNNQLVYAYDNPHYLGPLIIAQKDIATRVKFHNYLPMGAGGDLTIPVDTTLMGAGYGPNGTSAGMYSQNRATIHLHGGNTPWISDGTPHQWTVPYGENTQYPKGVSTAYVPDMDGGTEPIGTLTFYYTNQQSARLMFYHDHAYGITRLNVYAGEAAGYLVLDDAEGALVTSGDIPPIQIPLIIQDKTFVPDTTQMLAQDPTWNWGGNQTSLWPKTDDLWYPHVYMPAQNPNNTDNVNPMGRWDYGPWVWPPKTGFIVTPVTNPYYDPINAPWENPTMPGTPNPSQVPETFLDTPLINGNPYPVLEVGPYAYRFRMLNAANERFFNLQLYKAEPLSVSLTNGGTGYNTTPDVTFSGGGAGTQATATATISGSPVITIDVTNGGSGYTNAVVTFLGGGGFGAAADANVNLTTNTIDSITITNGGFDYTSAPAVIITGDGTNAAATATIAGGSVTDITIDTYGSGYSSAPTVTITGGNGTGAAAVASIYTEVKMVPAVSAPGFPASWPTDGRAGGVPDPAARGPSWYQIGSEGGFLPAVVVIPPQPVTYETHLLSSAITPVANYSLLLGPAERADVIVDFSAYSDGDRLILYNDAPSPFPGFDDRYDFYTGSPNLTSIGGAPSTLAGYGPNTRTLMQIRINGSLPDPGWTNLASLQSALPGAYASVQDKPLVPEAVYGTAFGTTYPNSYVNLTNSTINFTPAGQLSPVNISLKPKSVVEGFDWKYGRITALFGVEIPRSSERIEESIGYGYVDPPTEVFKNSINTTLIGTLDDGTQIWRMTHNGVDTHIVHWHMYNVQVLNRVWWDGTIVPPDPNEVGWKESLRIHALQDLIVAMRPIKPVIPWELPNSIRSLDVLTPDGAHNPMEFVNLDPNKTQVQVVNHKINFGWEYVWHCHLLGHEENDMMRSQPVAVAPNNSTNLSVTLVSSPLAVRLNWTDSSVSETGIYVERATNALGPWTTIASLVSTTGPQKGATITYSDTTVLPNMTYYYRILNSNLVGDPGPYTTVLIGVQAGYPTVEVNSTPSNVVSISTVRTGYISGYKRNASSGYAGIVGWNITLFNQTGGVLYAWNLTGPGGFYNFTDLPSGISFNVSEELRTGWTAQLPTSYPGLQINDTTPFHINKNFTNTKNPCPPNPTFTSISPISGYRNTTVSYTIVGTRFVPGLMTVTFRNATGALLNPTVLDSVTTTQIKGRIVIPAQAWIGPYTVTVSVLDCGSASKVNAFTVKKYPAPTLSSFSPTKAVINTTVTYTIAGTNFEPSLTSVVLTKSAQSDIPATVTSITPTQIKGTIFIPSGTATGYWNVKVTTVDGGAVTKTNVITVSTSNPPRGN